MLPQNTDLLSSICRDEPLFRRFCDKDLFLSSPQNSWARTAFSRKFRDEDLFFIFGLHSRISEKNTYVPPKLFMPSQSRYSGPGPGRTKKELGEFDPEEVFTHKAFVSYAYFRHKFWKNYVKRDEEQLNGLQL